MLEAFFVNDEFWARWEVPDHLRRKMLAVARSFRKEPTPSESILWKALRRKALDGIKFRRQQPIGPFVVDFYAPSHRLIVEVDGTVHAQQQQADLDRQALLEELGLHFLRLSAEQVENDLEGALEKIRLAVTPLSPDPFLPQGEKGE
jgi:very-short-patch-repair endonuclease